MKFCFVAPGYRSVSVLNGDTLNTGGAESQIAYMATAFAKLGHKVDLIYGDGRTGSTTRFIAGVTCIEAAASWRRPGSLLRLWKAIDESAADLIYSRLPDDFLWILGLYSRIHPQSRSLHAVANDRDCIPWRAYSYNRWFHNMLYALGLRSFGTIAVQHSAQAKLIKPHTNARLVTIPNYLRAFSREPREYGDANIDAAWVAQIRPAKQLQLLLDVAESLPLLRFAVIGQFSTTYESRERRALANQMEQLKNVKFLGPQSSEDVIQLLAHSKILVNTSSWEGFPNTMLEAWSVGVPVVSLQANPGGVIEREAIGVVSRTQERLINDVQRLALTPSLNHEMGTRGLEYVRKEHSLEAVCRGFERVMPGVWIPESDKQVLAAH